MVTVVLCAVNVAYWISHNRIEAVCVCFYLTMIKITPFSTTLRLAV